jgi:cytochrome c biogenesis protein CcdA/thiol-disulfide isomerase/thioredoxin
MPLLLFFSFLAGIFTILSPCILPILPAILSAGTLQGKWRPFGIILGLIISFTFFTLALTFLVHAFNLSANVLHNAAIVIVALFGIIMIFPALSDKFAKAAAPIAEWGQKIQGTSSSSGFVGGFVLGAALGLLWTPCAGPILATISTLVATQAINGSTILLTIAYSLGAAIPMFFIAYGGGKILRSSKFLASHAERVRQFFGGIMLLTAVALAFHLDMKLQLQVSTLIPPILIEDNPWVREALGQLQEGKGPAPEVGKKAPELEGIVNWINSPPLSLMKLKGKVILVDFWTYSCINCLRTLPFIKEWYEKYKDKGFVVIGVHTPEFEFEKDPGNVAQAVSRLHVSYPIAQDNYYATWEAYHNHYWPADYLIDQNGILRHIHFGEGDYGKTENAIRALLGLPAIQVTEASRVARRLTPETYLGWERGKSYTKDNPVLPDQSGIYNYTSPLQENQVGLKGRWKVEKEKIVSDSDESYLDLHFLAKNVYLVLSGSSKKPVEVFLDGKQVNTFYLKGDQKYDIVKTVYGSHQLSLKIPAEVSAYAFTFGDEPD